MAEIRIACPVCQSSIRVAEHMQGQSVHCPKCLSVVSLTKPRAKQEVEDDDLAMPVEANYDLPASPDDSESESPIPCPSCRKELPPKAKFCSKCGYHLAMETHFDDLIEENIHRQEAPKTKAEQWLERNLDERATPRDVLIWSGACTVIVAVLMMLFFRSYSVTGGTLVGILFAAGLGAAWFFGMRYLGLLEDPKRGQRLASETSGVKPKAGGKLFGGKREPEGFSPWDKSGEKPGETAPPGTYHPKPIEERLSLDDDDEDLATPVETPAPTSKKQTAGPQAGQGGKSPQSAAPQTATPWPDPPKQPPAPEPSENKEDWLDFFDDQQDRK